MKSRLIALGILLLCGFAAIAAHSEPSTTSRASASQESAVATHNFSKDTKVWVSDFDLDAGDVKTDIRAASSVRYGPEFWRDQANAASAIPNVRRGRSSI